MYIGLHVKYLLFLSDFHKTSLFFTVFEKYSNIKFHENSSSGSKVVPCRQMDRQTDGQTDMTKPIVSFHIFANAPKNSQDQSLSWLRVKLEMYVDVPDYSENRLGCISFSAI
jgi:hypothetical protein